MPSDKAAWRVVSAACRLPVSYSTHPTSSATHPARTRISRCCFWKPALTAAGLAADTTFHDLRHTFASTALAEGVPISEVSRWLGHKSITTTVDLYGHLVPEASGRARDTLDRAFAQAGMCPESAPRAQ
jgi:integrase